MSKINTFYIHIDLGDLIYSLCFAKMLGVKNYLVDPNRGICKFNKAGYDFALPLLLEQSYLDSVSEYSGQQYDVNYGDHPKKCPVVVGTELVSYHASKFDINPITVKPGWLECGSVDFGKKIVINRTPRYQNDFLFYHDFLRHIRREECLFVGLESEWKEFNYNFKKGVDFYKAETALDLAKVINGCEMFLGNQSLSCAIAIGLGKTSMIETGVGCANYIFRSNKTIYF